MPLDPDQLISHLQLKPHPEGGFYTETFRSPLSVDSAAHGAPRAASTAIYFLLRRQDISAFHRVTSDEVWHHYAGDALELCVIDSAGALRLTQLGTNLPRGERPQAVVARNEWQAARVAREGAHGFSLCGCTVAPGFEFADFELPARETLSARFPEHRALIAELTR